MGILSFIIGFLFILAIRIIIALNAYGQIVLFDDSISVYSVVKDFVGLLIAGLGIYIAYSWKKQLKFTQTNDVANQLLISALELRKVTIRFLESDNLFTELFSLFEEEININLKYVMLKYYSGIISTKIKKIKKLKSSYETISINAYTKFGNPILDIEKNIDNEINGFELGSDLLNAMSDGDIIDMPAVDKMLNNPHMLFAFTKDVRQYSINIINKNISELQSILKNSLI